MCSLTPEHDPRQHCCSILSAVLLETAMSTISIAKFISSDLMKFRLALLMALYKSA